VSRSQVTQGLPGLGWSMESEHGTKLAIEQWGSRDALSAAGCARRTWTMIGRALSLKMSPMGSRRSPASSCSPRARGEKRDLKQGPMSSRDSFVRTARSENKGVVPRNDPWIPRGRLARRCCETDRQRRCQRRSARPQRAEQRAHGPLKREVSTRARQLVRQEVSAAYRPRNSDGAEPNLRWCVLAS
jgi:hypothetical protein